MIQMREKTIVTLEPYEHWLGVQVGARRQMAAERRGTPPAFPEQYSGQLYGNHILGACAEIAVAKHLGAYWDGSVDVGARADIPSWNVDVRFSPTRPKIRPKDTSRIVAVMPAKLTKQSNAFQFEIVGWHNPSEARQRDEWRSDTEPLCWFPSEWRDIATLERPVE